MSRETTTIEWILKAMAVAGESRYSFEQLIDPSRGFVCRNEGAHAWR